jgi:hypothetical protein
VDGPDGHFDSKKELARWQVLKLLLAAGDIHDLERQIPYRIVINDYHVCDYIADFVYADRKNRRIVEDVKGIRTQVYRLKKKLLWAVHGIAVKET